MIGFRPLIELDCTRVVPVRNVYFYASEVAIEIGTALHHVSLRPHRRTKKEVQQKSENCHDSKIMKVNWAFYTRLLSQK